jgi:uncharacterized coiled-coil protein SlyX
MRPLVNFLSFLAYPLWAAHEALNRPSYLPQREFIGLDEPIEPLPTPDQVRVAELEARVCSLQARIDQLAGALAEQERQASARLEGRLADMERHVHASLGKAINRVPDRPAPQAQAEARKKIVIYGLKTEQFQHVFYTCKERAELRFVSRDLVRPHFPEGDCVILAVDYIGHGWDRAAVKKFGAKKVHRVTGCVSAVIDKIKKLTA